MNFLSQVEFEYPKAVSFASGRPSERFFRMHDWLGSIELFQQYDADRNGYDVSFSSRRLAQYGRTNGIIHELVARQLELDAHLHCDPENIVITNGCQEALSLCVQELCSPGDVVIARDPTYIGITGAALGAGADIVPLGETDLAVALRQTIACVRQDGKRPRLLYLIPEFDNPTSTVISVADRNAILAIADEERIIILEDGTYSMFRFEGSACPSLAKLDRTGSVIYLHTYSKLLCPSLRVGCAVVPKALFGSIDASRQLIASLSERKSYLSVNTSQINQAIVGGILLAEECSLERIALPARDFYRRNRDILMEELTKSVAAHCDARWNAPEGGFFLTLDLPFPLNGDDVQTCARDYGVIVMPMSFFSLRDRHYNCVRFAFSNLDPERVITGTRRFAHFVGDRKAAYRQ